jgi:hypothetical protein
MKAPRPIANWRQGWRMTSVQAALLLAFFSAVQAEVLPIFQPLVPPQYWPAVTGVVALLIVVLRLWSQPSLHEEQAPQEPTR